MITFITTLKPFTDMFKPLQINAINSWYYLGNCKQIIINTEFEDEVKKYFPDKMDKIKVLPHRRITSTGVPYVQDIFYSAFDHTNDDDTLCYINADIILYNDFTNSVDSILNQRQFKGEPYMMAGQRWNWTNGKEFNKLHDFENREAISNYINAHIRANGHYDVLWAIDYFVYSKAMYNDIIPSDLILGRCAWDIWLINAAATGTDDTFNLTKTTFVIHPKHGYAKNGVSNIEALKRSNAEIAKEFQMNKKYKCPNGKKINQFKYFTKYENNKIGIKEQ
jgi:hypothetical protein